MTAQATPHYTAEEILQALQKGRRFSINEA
jgi:hypothetical protein